MATPSTDGDLSCRGLALPKRAKTVNYLRGELADTTAVLFVRGAISDVEVAVSQELAER